MRASAEAAAALELKEKIAELKGKQIWMDQVTAKFHITPEAVCRRLDEFHEDMELRGRQVSNPQSLFVTWLTEQQRGRQSGPTPSEPGLGPGEWRDEQGRRRFDKSSVIVPEWAPPRPSKEYYWHEPSQYWFNGL